MKKMMSPKTTIVWVAKSGVADPYAPTATELNAGANISCAIVRGYTLNATASDVDNTASICDDANVDTPGNKNYEANLTFFRDDDRADIVSVYNIAWALFRRSGAEGYLYRRVGKKSTEPFVIGDEVEGFLVISDTAQTVDGGDNGGPIQFTVPFLQQGLMTEAVYVGPLPAPVVTSSTPATSPIAGGNVVVVAGTGFYTPLSITVGGVKATDFTVNSPTSLQINSTPPHAAGSAPVAVTTPGGTASGGAITYS